VVYTCETKYCKEGTVKTTVLLDATPSSLAKDKRQFGKAHHIYYFFIEDGWSVALRHACLFVPDYRPSPSRRW